MGEIFYGVPTFLMRQAPVSAWKYNPSVHAEKKQSFLVQLYKN